MWAGREAATLAGPAPTTRRRGKLKVQRHTALRTASLPWLVRSGIGRIVVVDPGTVDKPDLGRQVLYREAHLGQQKAVVTAAELEAMNPEVEVLAVPMCLDSTNISALATSADVILDGTDQIEPRRLVNAFSVATGKPWVYGGAVGWVGSVLACSSGSPCWECVFGNEPGPPNCDAAGVMGPVVGWVGATQAAIVLRLLLGQKCSGELLTVDLLNSSFRKLIVRRNPSCPVCQGRSQR
jgi:adenylyltransferase/sulfurtransferase